MVENTLSTGNPHGKWGWIISIEIQPVHSKGDQPWVFFGRTDAKAETPVLFNLLASFEWECYKNLGKGMIGSS